MYFFCDGTDAHESLLVFKLHVTATAFAPQQARSRHHAGSCSSSHVQLQQVKRCWSVSGNDDPWGLGQTGATLWSS